ncbi:unnamed protein product [Ilex paraguariensis]|uniref:NBS-LRR type disease resistance protein n=1 Tax=Ilex paraguariensis TaxID=185542 RepID=A0ABC8QRI0_9AQUA
MTCQGLPLAILTLAQLMSTKGHNPREWNDILQSLSSKLEDVNQILLLSYNCLPTHLKFCFLYCAMLPKNRRIKINNLIRLLVAEGFVTEIPGQTLEAVAKEYFFELSYRSLLHIITHRISREPDYYQMHDLLRDVAFHVIGKGNFGVIFSDQICELESKSKSRRLVIYETTPYTELDMSNWKLRSLHVFRANSFNFSQSQMLQSIKLLRVLHLENVSIESLPDEMGNLIQLRFLGLKCTNISKLPTSLRKLCHLQTLDIRGTQVDSLPDGIAELQQLRHLICSTNVRVSNLTFQSTQLQTLSGMSLNCSQARELGQLTQLRKLKVSVIEVKDCSELCASIEKLPNLESLTVRTTWNSEFHRPGGLERLLAPRFLEKLVLKGMLKTTARFFRHS